jgi:hypothetical protein
LAHHPELAALHFARDTSDWHETGQGLVSRLYAVRSWPLRFVIAPDGTLLHRYDTLDTINDEARLERAIVEALKIR